MKATLVKNVVERVVDTLQQQQQQSKINISVNVIRDASEKYRLLAMQIPVGTIQLQPASQKDTAERRAAALLEYCSRQQKLTGNSESNEVALLSWKSLADAVHAKTPEPIQQLQHILVNFLQPPSFVKANERKRQNKSIEGEKLSKKSSLEKSRSLRQRIHTINYKDCASNSNSNGIPLTIGENSRSQFVPRILPELVIRLAGHLVDPHGTQKLASQLLCDIYTYYEGNGGEVGMTSELSRYSNAAERRGHLYDLQRYWAAYEASALYHVATTMYKNNRVSLLGVSEAFIKKNKSRKTTATKRFHDEALNPEEENIDNDSDEGREGTDANFNFKERSNPRGLQIDDLIDASNEYTYLEIKQVLPHVQSLASKLKGVEKCASKRNRLPVESTRLAKSSSQATVTDKAPQNSGRADNCSTINDIYDESIDIVDQTYACDDLHKSIPSFVDWKENILSATLQQSKLELTRLQFDNTLSSNTLKSAYVSDDIAASFSADMVLQKYEIPLYSLKSN